MAKIATRRGLQPAVRPVKAATPRRHWPEHAWRLLAVWALVFIAYSNSFQAGLIFDNSTIIAQDTRIRQATPQNVSSILNGGYRHGNAGLYRPLTTFSYLVNFAVFGNGTRPQGYHWVNLALHAVNVALVYALGIEILGSAAAAWGMAALWGAHPLLTESITNVVGRADLLAAFGVLAGLLCYVRAASAAGRRKWVWLAGIMAAQTIGLFSKESAIVLPGIMLLYDFTRSDRATWRRRAPSYAALALPIAAFVYMRAQLHLQMIVAAADNPLVNAGFWMARLTALEVLGKFFCLFVWPARLSADYSYNAIPLFHWNDLSALLEIVLSMGAALVVAILALRRRTAKKPILFFLAFFLVAALPTSNLIVLIGSIMAERFMYLPSIGLAGCVVAAVYALARRYPLRHPKAAWAAVAAASLAFAARTYARNFDWKDDLSLWTSAVKVCPGSAKAHYNLAKTLESLPGRTAEAIAEYRNSIRIDPNHADVHNNLANALSAIPGRMPEAIEEYEVALRLEPDRAEPHNNLANALANMRGRLSDAIAQYRAALRIQSDNAEVHYNLANALVRDPGGLSEAIAEYRVALRIDPNHADAHTNLANALVRVPGRLPDAIAEYQAALRVQPDSVGAHLGLANALLSSPGRLAEAISEYESALRIRPDNAEAHYDFGVALTRLPGRLPDAIAEFESALRGEPNFFEAHVNLGNALAEIPGRRAEAIAEYDAALRIRPDPVVRQMAERLRAQRPQ
jgi:tetratricopeptide (TPR) repeat protein